MEKRIVVIDTETTWGDRVMSVGAVIADASDFRPLERRYYVLDPEYRSGGMFSSELFTVPEKETRIVTRRAAISEINEWLREAGIEKVFAYNASFDKNHLAELSGYRWYDIMRLAAYRQYNRYIPEDAPCCSTGKLKKGYGVEPIRRMMSGDNGYCELHNALQDACDELEIMRMLGHEIAAYEVGKL